jgi:hypothetical protein
MKALSTSCTSTTRVRPAAKVRSESAKKCQISNVSSSILASHGGQKYFGEHTRAVKRFLMHIMTKFDRAPKLPLCLLLYAENGGGRDAILNF